MTLTANQKATSSQHTFNIGKKSLKNLLKLLCQFGPNMMELSLGGPLLELYMMIHMHPNWSPLRWVHTADQINSIKPDQAIGRLVCLAQEQYSGWSTLIGIAPALYLTILTGSISQALEKRSGIHWIAIDRSGKDHVGVKFGRNTNTRCFPHQFDRFWRTSDLFSSALASRSLLDIFWHVKNCQVARRIDTEQVDHPEYTIVTDLDLSLDRLTCFYWIDRVDLMSVVNLAYLTNNKVLFLYDCKIFAVVLCYESVVVVVVVVVRL